MAIISVGGTALRAGIRYYRQFSRDHAGYQGVERREENLGCKALPHTKIGRMIEKLKYQKASVKAKVEHLFHVVKNLFRRPKARYRSLAKTRRNCLRCSASPIWCWMADDLR